MLGWMLKRGQNASSAADETGDTTQLDQPDTPAPVFAARAFKSALFGSPKRDSARQNRPSRPLNMAANEREKSATPSKPPGILLTPGTAAARRKRVSFGHEVPSRLAANGQNGENGPSKGAQATRARINATNRTDNAASNTRNSAKQDDSDEWEDAEDEDYSAHDMTLDLNEPHSQSGKYWKEEFQRYHEDAKAELEKLLKYKQLAKTYAQQKDAEAIALAEKLKDEQQKVIEMERLVSKNTTQIASAKQNGSMSAPPDEILAKLSQQTELAAQYREKVQDLEDQLDTVLREIESQPDEKYKRRRQGSASPSTHKALMETQRELRKAKSQLREMSTMRDQFAKMKTQLETAKQQTIAEQSRPSETSRMRELREKLRTVQEESIMKGQQLDALKAEFAAYREETTAHDADTRAVLERAHAKIADLKKELKATKSADIEKSRPKSWHAPAAKAAENEPSRHRIMQSDFETNTRQEVNERPPRSRTLRDKYNEDADDVAAHRRLEQSHNLSRSSRRQRNLDSEKSSWQPFVPRTPRDRGYLGEDVMRRLENGGTSAAKPKPISAPELPNVTTVGGASRLRSTAAEDEDVDLLRNRFAKLGGPDTQLRGMSKTLRTNLPPERRAAALARVEKRMAEKKRARARNLGDKENIRP